eukprot:GEMP01008646.1.p1 GENE.GEMP01008646.1~~GEMP01008646.1.p1  ORF type:complete len:432 (+),score=49.97 GEMP01008646.1:650-1945(+)
MALTISIGTPKEVLPIEEAVRRLVNKKAALQWTTNPSTMQEFLNSVEATLWSIQDLSEYGVNREYRNSFSYSYIHFFSKLKAGFAYGIIMGLSRVRDGLTVNGRKWPVNKDIRDSGQTLESKLDAMMHMITSIRWSEDDWETIESKYIKYLADLLMDFDKAYVSYEEALIPWLMNIEEHTRAFLSQIIEAADNCPVMFVGHIATLNAQCNKRGNGRSDLSYTEVKTAKELLSVLDACGHERDVYCSVHPKMRPILESLSTAFDDVQEYFSGLRSNLLCVDPQLSNNKLLCRLCERFESAWERVHAFCTNNRWDLLSTFLTFLDVHAPNVDCSSVEGALLLPRLLLLSSWEDHSAFKLLEIFSPKVLGMMENLQEEYGDFSLEQAMTAVDEPCDFMRRLEEISIHLQRYESKEWNRFLHVLFQSSAEDAKIC